MQKVPDISSELYDALALAAQRLNVLVEIYPNDALPGADGFDPDDALLHVAAHPTTFLGNPYGRYLTGAGNINRTITEKFNNVTFSLDNHDRTMAAFVLNNPLAGMFVVVRIISRELVATTLSDSFVVFTGKCEKTFDVNNDEVTISAKQYIGSVDEELPARAMGPEDEEGRAATDPLFEGFPVDQINITRQYTEKVRRGGFLGLLGFKKNVTRTVQYTSHTNLQPDAVVPILLGRGQIVLIPLSYVDQGAEVYSIFAAAEGPIKDWHNLKVLSPGYYPIVGDVWLRYGYEGGTNDQEPIPSPNGDNYVGNHYYSKTAWIAFHTTGSEVSQDDPAPDAVAVNLGLIIPLPDNTTAFSLEDFSDNPAFQTRWLFTDSKGFNLDSAFINDMQCIKTACYCDSPILDLTDGERVVLPNSLSASYASWWWYYHSTGYLSPCHFRHYFLGETFDPPPELRANTPTFINPLSPPTFTPDRLIRRRFTSNIYLKEKMKKVDFLFKILLPTYRGFITQNAKGKLDIKCKRSADNTILRSDANAGDSEVAVNSILPWVADSSGEIIVGTNLLTSEVRRVIGTRYSAVANDITLDVAGNLTKSGANFTGGDDNNPATASVTVTGLGTLTVTIDGFDVSYTTEAQSPYIDSEARLFGDAGDTIESAAAMLAHHLMAEPTFQPYIKFTWDKNNPTVISMQSKLGFLELSDPVLEEDHFIAEEVTRVQLSLADRLYTPADTPAANIIKGSMKWPIGSRQSAINRVDGTFIDSPKDFKPSPMRTRDSVNISETKKVNPTEINLTGVDSYSQAKRLELSALAELRDLDFFVSVSSDRRALLLEEGDVICCTHGSGQFRNLPLRIEEVVIDLKSMSVSIIGRRYATSAYSDTAGARVVAIPSGLSTAAAGPPNIAFNTTDYPSNGLMQTTASDGITTVRGGAIFGASIYGQVVKISLKRPGETTFTQIDSKNPDSDWKAVFEFIASEEGTYYVQLEVCFTGGGVCNTTKPVASITVAFGALGVLLLQTGGKILTQDGDYLAQG